MLTRWGVERPDDPFEILARSAGIRATDRIELAEYRSADDGLVTPLEFRVAGARHVPEHRRAELKPGVRVELRRERDNPVDANATIVVAIGGQQAGWVPRQYSELFARNLDGGAILRGDVVRQLLIPDEDGRWVVRAGREP